MTRAGRHWRIIAPLNTRAHVHHRRATSTPRTIEIQRRVSTQKAMTMDASSTFYSPRAAIKAAMARGP